jgi:hypothetical protein
MCNYALKITANSAKGCRHHWTVKKLYRLLLAHSSFSYNLQVAVGGVVVIVLATGPKVRGFKPGQG